MKRGVAYAVVTIGVVVLIWAVLARTQQPASTRGNVGPQDAAAAGGAAAPSGGGPGAASNGAGEAGPAVVSHGDSQAKVKIVAFYPLNERHLEMVEHIKTIVDKYPGKVYLQAWDFTTPEGGERWRASGLNCGGMLIDGQVEHEVATRGKKQLVEFKRYVDVSWTYADLEAVVAAEVAKAYPADKQ